MGYDTDYTLRLADPADQQALCDAAERFLGGPANVDLVAEMLADPHHFLAVALRDDQIVGIADAFRYARFGAGAHFFLHRVEIEPQHQNKGIGRRLVGLLLEQAAKLGCVNAWGLADDEDVIHLRSMMLAGGRPRGEYLHRYDLPLPESVAEAPE